jgi:hypothetical protein
VIELLFPVAAVVAGGLGLLLVLRFVDEWAISRQARRHTTAAPRPAAPRRLPWRRSLATAAVVALIAGGFAWLQHAGYLDPLRAEGPASGSGALYLGTEPATFGGRDNVDFAEVPGGFIEYTFSLRNVSDTTVTVTAIGDPVNGHGTWMDGLFDAGGLTPAGHGVDPTFSPFTIDPGNATRVTLTLRLRYCATWLPAPTLAPGTSPSAWAALAVESSAGGGTVLIERLSVMYDEGPFGGTASLDLPAGLALVERDGSGCPIGGESPSPSTVPAGSS